MVFCLPLLSFVICVALTVVIRIILKVHPSDNVHFWITIVYGVAINIVRRSQGAIPNGWGHTSCSSDVVELTAANRRRLSVAVAQWRYNASLSKSLNAYTVGDPKNMNATLICLQGRALVWRSRPLPS